MRHSDTGRGGGTTSPAALSPEKVRNLLVVTAHKEGKSLAITAINWPKWLTVNKEFLFIFGWHKALPRNETKRDSSSTDAELPFLAPLQMSNYPGEIELGI